jgi:hypothetical protein
MIGVDGLELLHLDDLDVTFEAGSMGVFVIHFVWVFAGSWSRLNG